ncbi:threonine synthase [Selenomonas sp. FOBRC6]|uniref:threonine synthase n=1 Tax=Selenomonas sp. FOBRC6 TaxID=936572 RepID=UPI0018DD66C0|nr:threonine synthase [Selenomonas sp. FOBRC6]
MYTMDYFSTRGATERVSSAEAILKGLASDGGLFVPASFPQMTLPEIEALRDLSYEERAVHILRLYLTDYTEEELKGCVSRAYGHTFDDVRRAPVRAVGDLEVLELWHGPTSAFKDMALQLLPQLMSTARAKTGEQDTILILVATSGDTGKAALDGFADAEGIRIMVFYPDGGVSPVQRLQMVTQEGANVSVVAVRGNFDDAQRGVKEIFGDTAMAKELAALHTKLSSANSICCLLADGKIEAGDPVNFTVPTGNFGNILAGYYAKRMGLPVGKLVCASNANNVLTDFLQTGIYDRQRDFYQTMSPSMDILVSSNLERLLYHLAEDTRQVAAWMQELTTVGKYNASSLLPALRENFWAAFADDRATEEEIRAVYERTEYTLDTHTAVAYRAAEDYRRETGDARPMVVLSTASPYKFGASVLHALGEDTAQMDEFAQMECLHARSKMEIPVRLAALRTAVVLHEGVCEKDGMHAAVLSFAEA